MGAKSLGAALCAGPAELRDSQRTENFLGREESRIIALLGTGKGADILRERWHLRLGYVSAASRKFFLGRPASQRLGTSSPAGPTDGPKWAAWSNLFKQGLDALEGQAASDANSLSREWITSGLRPGVLVMPVCVDSLLVGAVICADSAGGMQRDWDARASDLSQDARCFIEYLVEGLADELVAQFKRSSSSESSSLDGTLRQSYLSIIGSSEPMKALYGLLDKVATSDTTVLVTGENGTGKELVARAIHLKSHRRNERFLAHNCSAFNDSLLESELFGHNRGAFSGATSDKEGLFEAADRGTFFLDEIGDMSPALQVKVLRVLQDGHYTSVGSTVQRHVDVRIIAATNRDLHSMVEQGLFREDLYYRIHVINLNLPPLRERIEDIEILVRHFLNKHGARGKEVSSDCLEALCLYRWPGNVRELENEIERLIVLSGSAPLLHAAQLSKRMQQDRSDHSFRACGGDTSSLPVAVKALERRMIRAALLEHRGNKTRAAAQLQVSRRNLIRLVQKFEMDGPE